ncbi:MAG: hypothetical protein KBT45_06535 [Bacteroidales bacterium]|nr:hypothetical protein [Candidatus Colimorpha pelethequi]
MKKIFIIVAFIYCNICFAQKFSAVKIYVSNPYVERVSVIKSQMYNMDYVRSHYATYIFSMEENYINNLYDSLSSLTLKSVLHDSIYLVVPSYDPGCIGTVEMDFEPCIVIDFIGYDKFNLNESHCTFSVNRQGFIHRSFPSKRDELCYANKKCLDFLERQFPGMVFFQNKSGQ